MTNSDTTQNWSILKKSSKLQALKQNTDENIEISNQENENDSPNEQKEILNEAKSVLKKIEDLIQIKEKLKISEINRIILISINDESQLENLEKRLRILFGKKESETIFEIFKREKKVSDLFF